MEELEYLGQPSIDSITQSAKQVKAIRGVYNQNSSPPTEDEVIDLVLVFDEVRSLEDNDFIVLLWLLYKIAFLLAITIAS
ncbi:hypothetical protein F8M41_010624 [Gigaspora margarita]|uniref:Uncharacterized protein n=1 Tax=Gigaspora margarita TaxID=4874 RepID=A0A8H4AU86_GIGMA|nr:hypothetical protein F8M41_010624 [Gigaspora margarita]